jgi:hypothetical protein
MFLGFVNYYLKFVDRQASILVPISELLKGATSKAQGNTKVMWTDECEEAFARIKVTMSAAPVLVKAVPGQPFIIFSDASDFATGAVLMQEGEDGHLHPISFLSKKLDSTQRNYAVYDKEGLGVIEALSQFRCYYEGSPVLVYTDHLSLTHYRTQEVLNRRQARWLDILERGDVTLIYKRGEENLADALSRRPDHFDNAATENLQRLDALSEGAREEIRSRRRHLDNIARLRLERDETPSFFNISAQLGSARRNAWPRADWSDRDDYMVDPGIFQEVEETYGTFDVDAAADDEGNNSQVEFLWFSKSCNALAQRWAGLRVWCNPPYSQIQEFLLHAWGEWSKDPFNTEVFFLLPERPTASWWTLCRGMAVVQRWGAGTHLFTKPGKNGGKPRVDVGPVPFDIILLRMQTLCSGTHSTGGASEEPEIIGGSRKAATECHHGSLAMLEGEATAADVGRDVREMEQALGALTAALEVRDGGRRARRRPARLQQDDEHVPGEEITTLVEAVEADVTADTAAHEPPYKEIMLDETEDEAITPDLLPLFQAAYTGTELEGPEGLPEDIIVLDRLRLRRTPAVSGPQYRVVVPNSKPLRDAILQIYHDNPLRGHQGERKLGNELQAQFEWQGMWTDIKAYIHDCPVCQSNKSYNTAPGELRPLPIPKERGHISMDYITSLPRTQGGHDMVLTCIERLTKKVRLVALKEQGHTSAQFWDVFKRQVKPAFSIVTALMSDRDPKWTAVFSQEVAEMSGIKHSFTSGGWARGNGEAERANQLVEQMLRIFCQNDHLAWDEHLQEVEDAINQTVSQATGMAPCLTHDGVPPAALMQRALPVFDTYVKAYGGDHGSWSYLGRSKDAIKVAMVALGEAQQNMRRWQKGNRRTINYIQGEKVWLSWKAWNSMKLSGNVSPKLANRWYGPYEIKRVMPNAVELILPSAMKSHPVFNVSYVRPSSPTLRTQPNYARPPPIFDVDGTQVYEVESVLQRRIRKHELQYLIKWKGYDDPRDRSWEPAYVMRRDVPHLVDEFESQLPGGEVTAGGGDSSEISDAPAPNRTTRAEAAARSNTTAQESDTSATGEETQEEKEEYNAMLDDIQCIKCGKTDKPRQFVLCSNEECTRGAHFPCLGMSGVPKGDWFCQPECQEKEITKRITKVVAEARKRMGLAETPRWKNPTPQRAARGPPLLPSTAE